MRKLMIFLAAIILIAFAFMSTGVFAGEGIKDPMAMSHEEVSSRLGREVKNAEGEHLGLVRDFLHDSEGRISFAIISTGGFLGFRDKKVAVPYSALAFDNERQHFICDVSTARFAEAPVFERGEKLMDQASAEEAYRYFGQRPYWTDEPARLEGWDWDY